MIVHMSNRLSLIATLEAAVSIGAALTRRPELLPLAVVSGVATVRSTYLAFAAVIQEYGGDNDPHTE
jgi:hypothetical protein